MVDRTREQILRQIPSVDRLLSRPSIVLWIQRTSRSYVISQIQELLQEIRKEPLTGNLNEPPFADPDSLEQLIDQRLGTRLRPNLKAVINATGVILHTNLGRAPLSNQAQERLSAASSYYINLEYDLETGKRSHRDLLVESLLRRLLDCEAATVVNNNAAAVFLVLNTLAHGREAIVSRGELIEIGGSFRIPDIMALSGAILREVGTTNKTRAADYAAAIGPETALLLRIHPSNYRIRGFTRRPELGELVQLARGHQIPLVEDIGSGCLLNLAAHGISEEPVAMESLAVGADLICFSADKLLGGPQAGVIAGSRKWVDQIRENPLMRTYRVEKLIYAALEATLASYITGRALKEIPVLRMISATREDLLQRAKKVIRRLRRSLTSEGRIDVFEGNSVVGGGSCPDSNLPTALISIELPRLRPNALEARLRSQDPPIIVRVENDKVLIDLRTVFPSQETSLIAGLEKAFL